MSLRVTFAGVATVAAVVVLGGSPVPAATARGTAVSQQDTAYLRAAHQGNLAEIAAGKVAQAKGVSDAVRSIGATLVADHTELDAAVREAARRLDVTLPTRATQRDRAMLERVSALSGPAFDRAWVTAMIAGHRAALRLGKKELQEGSSTTAKEVAQSGAPVIRKHLNELLNAQK
ncbi:DUF4142 domain-containing protein [Nonomuraea sp. NPDC005501]|uniref:DUF4142 domain-containing protein n=1 Tax=Nonomuraea sp. NPDC005501 TaxID=3156884 RepID=UPI0033A0EB51